MIFSLNTKKQNEPTLNTAVAGKSNAAGAVQTENDAKNAQTEAYIRARMEEVEAQKNELLKKVPDFDMRAELDNPAFKEYVWKNGLTVEEAYVLTHHEEIISEAIKEALGRLDARRNRILENGAGKNSPAVVKKNPKDMSDKEIDMIIERAQNGEKISF